jgi:hypothetical protein
MVDDPEGIHGNAEWFPGREVWPELGPSEHEFTTAYRGIVDAWPDYPGPGGGDGALVLHCA